MNKILILGASGMAGHVAYTYLNKFKDYEVIGTTNSNNFGDVSIKLDVFDSNAIEKCIDDIKPTIVINCVGMLIRSSKEHPDHTVYANAFLPHFLAKLSKKLNFKLIHISTDCVFSGKDGNYTEASFKDATDLYGMSKSLGEINDDHNLTIRTSIIGPEIKQNGEGLFHWFMQQQGEITGYKSNFWSGVTTLELAKFLHWIIDNPMLGLIHLTNNDKISKFDLLSLFNEVHQKGVIINSDRDYICDKSFKNTLISNYNVLSYEAMIKEQKEFIETNKEFYHY